MIIIAGHKISAGAEIIKGYRQELDGASRNGRSHYEKIIGIENPENEKLPDRANQTQPASKLGTSGVQFEN